MNLFNKKKFFLSTKKGLCLALLASFLLAACSEEADSSSLSLPLPSSAIESSSVVSSMPEPEFFREDIDFEALHEINEDVIAWIEVPGTVIDYPVMRGVDNAKYLSTSFEGEYDMDGAIFADMQLSDDLTEAVTVLYGHFTVEETFFTQLHNYKDPDYFEQHPDMFLYTPTRQEKYEVVAALTIDNRNIIYQRDFSDPVEMQSLLDWLGETTDEEAVLNLQEVLPEDRLMILSTCVAAVGGTTERYIVVSKLVEERPVQE